MSDVVRPTRAHLAALVLVACGRIEGGGTVSVADSETGGVHSAGGSGQSGTGGNHAGNVATGGDHATGGLASTLPEPWSPCNYEHPGLEPSCGEADVNGLLSGCGLWFDVPLAHVVPPALDLQVVLLPLAPSAGTAGMGGMGDVPTEPLVLDIISVVPTKSSRSSRETFDLVEVAGYVRAGNAREDELPGYVAEADEYGVARVALLQGTETISVYRGLYLGTTDSVGPGDLCVK